MRICKQPGKGKNTCAKRKRAKPTDAEKKLAKRIAGFEAIPLSARKGYRCPGSLKKG